MLYYGSNTKIIYSSLSYISTCTLGLEGTIQEVCGIKATLFVDIELKKCLSESILPTLFACIFFKLYLWKQSCLENLNFLNCPLYCASFKKELKRLPPPHENVKLKGQNYWRCPINAYIEIKLNILVDSFVCM